jgi:hypothetical protein
VVATWPSSATRGTSITLYFYIVYSKRYHFIIRQKITRVRASQGVADELAIENDHAELIGECTSVTSREISIVQCEDWKGGHFQTDDRLWYPQDSGSPYYVAAHC